MKSGLNIRLLVLSAICFPFIISAVYAQTAPDTAVLTAQVQKIIAAHHGKVALFAEDYATHKTIAIDADTPVPTESVIKLAILYETLEEIRAGKARWDEHLTFKKGDAVPGSGILQYLDTPLTLTLRDAVTLMIDLSDNTATNLLIDRFGIAPINARMESIGLKNTHLYKKVFKPATGPMPPDQKKFGLGKTTPREIAELITRFGRCQLSSGPPTASDRALCSTAIDILRNQTYRKDIPRYIEPLDSSDQGTAIANKAGEGDTVRNDVALIGTKHGLLVIAVFTYDNQDRSWTADNAGDVTIARIAKAIVYAWAPDGLTPEALYKASGN